MPSPASRARVLTTFLILSMTGGVIFQVAYIRFVYLTETYTALHLTGQQYGTIVSIFGATATIMYFLGGWFADRFAPRTLITAALAGVGVADLYIATAPGFTGILLAHIVTAVLATGLYWPALIKAIGLLGDEKSQGRFFGFLEGVRGITSTVIGLIGTAVVANAISTSHGILTLMRIYGVIAFVLAALVFFLVKGGRGSEDSAPQAVSLRQLVLAARNPFTWLIGGTIAMSFCFYTTLGYFSPLLQHSFGVSVGVIGVIGVIRSYVFQFVAGPAGGLLVDKVAGSSTKFLRIMFLVSAAMAGVFLVLPRQPEALVLALVVLFVLTLAVFMSRGVYWATVGELGIPTEQRGGVIGLASGIAYLPDAFLPALCAWWIGDPAAGVAEQGGGYTALFGFLVVAGVVGFLLTLVTDRLARRRLTTAVETATV